MSEYLLIETSNGLKYAVIDTISYNNQQYFLTTEVNEEETEVSEEFKVYIYNNINNELVNVEDIDEYDYVNSLFEERLKSKELEIDILSNIDVDSLIKLKIIDIDGYNYKLEQEGKIIKKYITFYTKTQPKVNDYIYIAKSVLEEDVLQYGYIHELSDLTTEEILIVSDENNKIYYKRYYG